MNECIGPYCRIFQDKSDSLCFKIGIFPECSPKLKAEEKERIKHWCPQHGYPVPCHKCGYNGELEE